MLKYFFPFIFTTFLLANTLSITQTPVAIDEPFMVDSNDSLFDDTLSYTHQPLLSCQPKLDAVYKVESAKQLKVIPKSSLSSASVYTCSYGSQSLAFQTEPFKVMENRYFKREKIVRLSFNDNIDAKTLFTGITLTKIDKLSTTNLDYTVLHNDGKNLILKINETIGESGIKLEINPTLLTQNHASLTEPFVAYFNAPNPEIPLNSKKEAMNINNKPQMVALNNGSFALRIFLDDTLEGNPLEAIAIEGIEDFKLNKDNYMDYSVREKYHVSDDTYYYTDVISSEFKPNTSYNVTLKKGFKTYRELKEDKQYTLQTGDRAKSVIFDGDKPYISNNGELGFSSVNIDKATLIVERVLDENLRYFMNFTQANQEEIDVYTKEIFSKTLTLNNTKNEILEQKFLLADLDKKNLPVGIYKVTLRYDEQIDGKTKEHSSSKILFLSDLGISANIAKEQAFVSVVSLSKALPMEDVEVEIYGANNALLATEKTNQDGIAIINKTKLLEAKPKGIIVKTAHDSNFLTLNEAISTPTVEEILENKERFKAHVYFQSNIVRPAEKIHALITVKDRDFISASKLPIQLVFQEVYGKVLHKKVYHTDEYGLIDFNYQLDVADKTGSYALDAFIGDKNIGHQTIKVEAFMPPQIENTIVTNKEIYQANELMEVNISSAYLFGAPASNLNGSLNLSARATTFDHPDYKNYTFSNERIAEENSNAYIDDSESFNLNGEGKYALVLPTKTTQKVPSVLKALIGVTIMDDTQPVATYKEVLIYPYKAMVGLKINNTSFEKGKKLEGKAVLIDPVTAKPIQRELSAVIKEIKWHYDYSDGNYNWQKEINVIDSFSINANEEFSRDVPENGTYLLEVEDLIGGHSSSSNFDVWGWAYSNISPKNDLKSIEINVEDKLYQKGDKVEVNVKSPILEGQLLITLEGDKVEDYKHIDLHKGVAQVTFPIEIEMKRGLRIHATAVRASDTPSNLIPFRAMGYKFIKPNRMAHQIKVTMNAPKVSKSNTSIPLIITTNKPSKVLVSVVDKGILQLVGQEKPELFDYFNDEADQNIAYYDLYDQLMSHIAKGALVDFGAGDSLSQKQKHLAPDLGKRIKPFMLWSGIVSTDHTDHNDSAKFTIEIPEFNGRATVVALAINEDGVGVDSQKITIKDDVMLKPSYPKYALAGDKIDVPVRIFNTTQEAKVINITGQLTNNLALTLSENNITIPANSSKVIQAKLNAKTIGKGEIVLTASYNNEQISRSVELPIYNPYAISTETFKGISNKAQSFTPPSAYADAKVMLTLSNNLIGALRDDLAYLVDYPYGCAEQTTSQISAMHHAKAFLANDILVGESQNFIRQGIKKLSNMQNYYGEFTYWEGEYTINAYASLYAGQTLLELQRDGVEIDEDVIGKIVTMLKSVATQNGSYEGGYSEFHRVYAGFILAEHQKLDDSIANMLYEQGLYKKHFLATYYMSAILKMQGKVDEANRLFNEKSRDLAHYALKPYQDTSGNFESNVRDMLLHFMIKSQYFNKEANDLVIIQREFPHLYSTQTKAVALKAISLFLGKPENSTLNVKVGINGTTTTYVNPITVVIDKLKSKTIDLTPQKGAMSYNVELIKHLEKPLKNKLSSTQKLSIMREFIDEHNQTVNLNTLHQGDTIYAKITLANYGEINNVVVNQRVPACLSIVNNAISNQKNKFSDVNIEQGYREIRDDRVLNFMNLKKKELYNKQLKRDVIQENRSILYTPLMVTTQGECQVPAVIVEAMYDSQINDYARDVKQLIIQ